MVLCKQPPDLSLMFDNLLMCFFLLSCPVELPTSGVVLTRNMLVVETLANVFFPLSKS